MTIDKERWKVISPLLDRLLDADAAGRVECLAETRRSDPELADVVEALLAERAVMERCRFLEGNAGWDSVTLAGRTVGNYTLEHPIGHGGMGSVWLARRSDGRFEGHVAVKFLNLALIGRGGPERFEREGRALARLSHPHIARLMDAGILTGTQPYLVLEYVAGVAIDRWCDEHTLSVKARLLLFLDVLAAAAHAHQNLILHCDLKSSNILVTRGEVKLLDFGIAKLLDDDAVTSGSSALTEVAGRPFTPEFAAPEQIEGKAVTTATDVYSLGMLLYALLSGRHPIQLNTNKADRLRAALEYEARRVSDTVAHGDELIALQRGLPRARLARLLRGDLDNIVAKALKKSPNERYQTATAFADDIKRYLDEKPVTAYPDALGYRLRKFVRRNRLGVAALSAVALSLAGGAAATIWQAREASHERDRALAELTRAEAASGFVEQMITGTWGEDERISRSEFLARAEQLAMRALNSKPEQQATVLMAIGNYYSALGDHSHADSLERRAVELMPAGFDVSWRATSECDQAFASWLVRRSEVDKARIVRWASRTDIDPDAAAKCELNLATLAWNSNDAKGALDYALRARDMLNSSPRRPAELMASMHGDLGYAYVLNGKSRDADREYAQAIEVYRNLDRLDSPSAIAILNNWAISSLVVGDIKHGLAVLDEVIRLANQQVSGAKPPPYAAANRATVLLSLGRYREAIDQADSALVLARDAHNKIFETSALATKAGAYTELGVLEAADRFLGEAKIAASDLAPEVSIKQVVSLRESKLLLAKGEPARARDTIEPTVAFFEKQQSPSATLVFALLVRADALHRLGDRAAAMSDAQTALRLAQHLQADWPFSFLTGQSWLLLARLERDQGQLDASRAAATSANQQLTYLLGDTHRDTLLARELAGRQD